MYNGDTKEFDFEEKNTEDVNRIVEIRNGEEIETLEDDIIDNMSYEEPKLVESKSKKKGLIYTLKDNWNDLSKKNKLIVILIGIAILVIIAILLIVLLKKDVDYESSEEPVVLEADNYRYENGKLFFLDSNDKEIGSYECQNKKENLCYVAYSSNEDNFDVEQNIYEDESAVQERMRIINDNYVFIYDNEKENEEKIILYSISENTSSEEYKLVKQYNKNSLIKDYVVVKNADDEYSLILFEEEKYEEVFETKYDYLGIITENKTPTEHLVATKNDKWYLIDFSDKEKTKAISYEIKDYNDKFLSVVNENDKYLLYDYENNQVTDETYDYIDFAFDYVSFVKDDKLKIYDKSLNKLHEEAFELENEYYNKINVFNKKSGVLEESRYAFSIALPQQSNSIALYLKTATEDTEVLINTLESKVNANYANINYFDGKLYIYSDAEKTNVIGKYECTNPNNITSEDSVLDNCFIASNSEFNDNDMNYAKNNVGLLPIFNNRFVFIKDNPEVTSAETMNIVLYDLASSKKLSTYRAIDAGIYNGRQNISFVEGTGLLLMAKNTKDYYGILKVNLSEVGSLANVKFGDKIKKIEMLGDYYMIQKATDTYYLINKDGDTETSEFSGKIMGYKNNYVKVKNGSDYKVYTFDGDEVSSDKYKYVELYTSVFAGVDSNDTINIYKYSDASKMCSTNKNLNITNNYKEGKSFKVEENNGIYSIAIKGTEELVYTCPEATTDNLE